MCACVWDRRLCVVTIIVIAITVIVGSVQQKKRRHFSIIREHLEFATSAVRMLPVDNQLSEVGERFSVVFLFFSSPPPPSSSSPPLLHLAVYVQLAIIRMSSCTPSNPRSTGRHWHCCNRLVQVVSIDASRSFVYAHVFGRLEDRYRSDTSGHIFC